MSDDKKYREIRAQRRKQYLIRMRRQFGIYHKSPYGKAGLYILIIFAVIAVLSPVLAPQPYSYIAPSIDTHVAHMRFESSAANASGNSQYMPLEASSTVSTGSYVLYYSTTSGKVYSDGFGGSQSTPLNSTTQLMNLHLNATNSLFSPDIATFSSYSHFVTRETLQLSNFIIAGTQNGTVTTGQVKWSGGELASGSPELVGISSVQENGTLVHAPVSNSQKLTTTIPTYVPFYGVSSQSQVTGTTSGTLASFYTVTHNSTGYYLNAYRADPLSHQWSIKVSSSQMPSKPVFYGSFFTAPSGQIVLEEVGNSLIAYSAGNGTVKWTKTFSSGLVGHQPYIPEKYQFRTQPANGAFVATSNNNVYLVYMGNGSARKVLHTSTTVNYIASSPGSSGFPSYLVTESNSTLYMTIQNNGGSFLTKEFNVPKADGSFNFLPSYDENSASFMIGSSKGYMVSVKATLGQYPFTWQAKVGNGTKSLTQPLVFLDSATGRSEIGVIDQNGSIFAYDAIPKSLNPIPPTLHTQSGNVYLLGTNIEGQDVFSQFIQSFVFDWYLGIAIGIAVMVIAVVVAMLVGYMGGIIGSSLETITLAIYLIPGLALLIALASVLGAGYTNIILIVTFISWPFTTFTLIGLVRQIRSRAFVESARLSGAGTMYILRKHVLPNIAPLLLYLLALSIDGAITGVSTLQFLGLAPLTTPTWGGMLSPMLGNFFLAARAPWWVLPPAIALTMFIFAFIFVSRGLDEVTNPRLRRR